MQTYNREPITTPYRYYPREYPALPSTCKYQQARSILKVLPSTLGYDLSWIRHSIICHCLLPYRLCHSRNESNLILPSWMYDDGGARRVSVQTLQQELKQQS